MENNTHMAVGVASSLIILQPKTDTKELVLGITLAIVGSLISDIDMHNSKANKAINKIIWVIGITGIISLTVDYFLKLGIYENILNDVAIMRILVSISLFSIILMFAKLTPHRTFSHSLIGITSFYIPVSIIFDQMSNYFLIAIISHVVIDLFNKKKVKLFYPLKKGVCFKLCYSNGVVNKVLLFISSAYILYSIIAFILNVYPNINLI